MTERVIEMDFNTFLTSIQEIRVDPGRYRHVFIDHLLDVRYGYDDEAYPSLFIKIDKELDLKQVPSTQCIQILNTKYKNGEVYLTFSIVEQTKEKLFIRLCYDILEASMTAQTHAEAVCLLIKRFDAWRKMFDNRSQVELSKEKIQGLCGELLYFLHELKMNDPKKVVAAWRGPCRADQDFTFDDYWTEVKTVKWSTTKVQISSLEQLAVDQPGILAVYKLEDSDESLGTTFTLFSLVQEIEGLLANFPSEVLAFHEKLSLLNVDIEMPVYKTTAFVLKETVFYEVKDGFPRLTPELRKRGIVTAEYAISLEFIESFRKDV